MTRLSFREPEGMVVVLTVGKATVLDSVTPWWWKQRWVFFFYRDIRTSSAVSVEIKNRYLGPKHDIFLILTKPGLCLNLTWAQAQCEMESLKFQPEEMWRFNIFVICRNARYQHLFSGLGRWRKETGAILQCHLFIYLAFVWPYWWDSFRDDREQDESDGGPQAGAATARTKPLYMVRPLYPLRKTAPRG